MVWLNMNCFYGVYTLIRVNKYFSLKFRHVPYDMIWRHLSSLPYQFSIFEDMGDWQPWNLDNSNSGSSNFLLTRTKFPFLDQNFTEIYPDNSNSLLTWTVFRFPSEFELLGIYCSDNNNNSDDDDDDDDDYYKCNKKWWPSRSTSILLLSFLIKLEY